MIFLLSHQNIWEYLAQHQLCDIQDKESSQIDLKSAKNFNLLLTFANTKKLLVKQERQNQQGKTAGEFFGEWKMQEIFRKFEDFQQFQQYLPEVLHFDLENSIMVVKYLDDYQDLMEFYTKEKIFDHQISSAIGSLLGRIHSQTFKSQEYEDFFTDSTQNRNNHVSNYLRHLEYIEPEIFGRVPADALKFFTLYQRYDSLGQALSKLAEDVLPSCLIHNDLKLNNILLHNTWEEPRENIIRLIDWERSQWGDPALDLGTLISSYIQLWLGSLIISKSLSIEESLQLATTPLDKIQPSIAALTKSYLQSFPQILEHRPDFLHRVIQFVGFGLIQRIHAMIEYQKTFGNGGIAMLQVAKTLLCRPSQSMSTIFPEFVVAL